MSEAYFISYFIGVIIVSIICGIIAKAITSNRGMEGGFWWGFWLWIIGIIIVAVRPNETPSRNPLPVMTQEEEEQGIISRGGWRCECGKVNFRYMTNCRYCGKSRDENNITIQSKSPEPQTKKDDVLVIREYKSLLDEGIITQEEFEAKKKQLLGL